MKYLLIISTIILALFSACNPKSKRYTVYCSNDYIGISNGNSMYLSDMYKSDSTFFDTQIKKDISSSEWKKAMNIFISLGEKQVIGKITNVYKPYNLCMPCQIMFYENEKPISFVCLGEREGLISIDQNIYKIDKEDIGTLKNLLKIGCNFNDPTRLDGAYYSVGEVNVVDNN